MLRSCDILDTAFDKSTAKSPPFRNLYHKLPDECGVLNGDFWTIVSAPSGPSGLFEVLLGANFRGPKNSWVAAYRILKAS